VELVGIEPATLALSAPRSHNNFIL